MKKKGVELAVGTVIMIVLGLAVLVILILVVRQQVTKGAKSYTEIGEQVTMSGGCSNILEGRACVKGSCPPDMDTVSGTWADCNEKGQKSSPPTSYTCCKKKET